MKMPTSRKHLLQIIPVIVLAMTVPLASVTCGQQRKVYEPTWESLDQHQTSEWLVDAKRGLFIYARDSRRQNGSDTMKQTVTEKGLPDMFSTIFPTIGPTASQRQAPLLLGHKWSVRMAEHD